MDTVSLDQVMAATGGRPKGFSRTSTTADQPGFRPGDISINHIGMDSRTLAANQLFWAIRGERHDGHHFVLNAKQRGAVASVVQRTVADESFGPRIEVEDTLTALGDFARWYREQLDALIIGVTGSFGKTTTRSMIHATLSAGFHGCQSPQNYNNHIGVPLSLLGVGSNHDFAVLEFGASALGEISELAHIAAPEIGVVTGIGSAHLEGFGNEDNIVLAKGELLEAIPESGFAVLAGDDSRVLKMAKRCRGRVITVGEQAHNQLVATNITCSSAGLDFDCEGYGYHVNAYGRHFVTSALIAIAIGREIGMSAVDIDCGLRSFQPVPGRCEVRTIGRWTVIDDTYNANPSSMTAACEMLSCWQGDTILISGDMLELGANDIDFHRTHGAAIAKSGIQRLIAFGSYADVVANGALAAGMSPHHIAECVDFGVLTTVLDCWLQPDSVVMVKGSRGMRMERVIEWLIQQTQLGSYLSENTVATATPTSAVV
ncbi:MAG: UDP-N-acetylmuramoyl-tripeptide--D-alanyl-D-alanine ligase [Planctomycetota bacterium]|nr:UDP-N-acetylmuramoyl-tripeptide--D-alanyl-D-alanine ligase [Planctomycetota bacterium]